MEYETTSGYILCVLGYTWDDPKSSNSPWVLANKLGFLMCSTRNESISWILILKPVHQASSDSDAYFIIQDAYLQQPVHKIKSNLSNLLCPVPFLLPPMNPYIIIVAKAAPYKLSFHRTFLIYHSTHSRGSFSSCHNHRIYCSLSLVLHPPSLTVPLHTGSDWESSSSSSYHSFRQSLLRRPSKSLLSLVVFVLVRPKNNSEALSTREWL